MKYFSHQLRDCQENGTSIIIPIPDNDRYTIKGPPITGPFEIEIENIIVCTKYKKICSSIVCKEERMKSEKSKEEILEKYIVKPDDERGVVSCYKLVHFDDALKAMEEYCEELKEKS
ncbi:MAG: hypothetical protein H8E98_04575 [Bacteroidetes bacterium]|nr:hypothetical protein [Bacteroidota bacterium]